MWLCNLLLLIAVFLACVLGIAVVAAFVYALVGPIGAFVVVWIAVTAFVCGGSGRSGR